MLKLLAFLCVFGNFGWAQGDNRLLWYTDPLLQYPSSNATPWYGFGDANPLVLSEDRRENEETYQNADMFKVYYKHDSAKMYYDYGVPTPLLYMGIPAGINPALVRYYEPVVGRVIDNIGPTVVFEIHIGRIRPTPLFTKQGIVYVDIDEYPYVIKQILLPWYRLLYDLDNTFLFGTVSRYSTWSRSHYNFVNLGASWVSMGGFRTNPMRPLSVESYVFNTEATPSLSDGDLFVAQMRVTYLFPANSNLGLFIPYTLYWDMTFWSNPIYVQVRS